MTIWSNTKLSENLRQKLAEDCRPHRVIFASQSMGNLAAGAPDPTLEQAEIAFGQPDPGQIIRLNTLRWIHLSSAGYARYDRDDIRSALKARGAMLTNSSAVFSEPCAQHAIAFMLANARRLPEAFANQSGPRHWPAVDLRGKSRLLIEQSVLILGFGSIARRLVELLEPFHMKITVIRNKPRGDEPVPTFPVSEVERLLPQFDHVMNILPDSPATQKFMSAARLSLMKPGAVFYNIGRGNTVDQATMIELLNAGRISAYLDVTDPEPLPPDHPLWIARNCHITPHTAGGHDAEFASAVRVFVDNLKRFDAGQPLRDRVM